MRLYIACVAAHAAVTFLLFSIVFLLPDSAETAITVFGGVTDILLQPFMGPQRLFTLPESWGSVAGGAPLYFASSLVWGVLLYASLRLLRRSKRKALA